MLIPLIEHAGYLRRVAGGGVYHQPDTEPLNVHSCNNLQGVYQIGQGKEHFGKDAVVKWSYTVEGKKTEYHLSFFCEKNGTYMICEGRRQGNDVLLNGYWRKAAANGTGLVRLLLKDGYEALQTGSKSFTITGWFGHGGTTPTKPVSLQFQHDLPYVPPLDIIAHRGGARNVDFLAVSENTVEMTKRAARLGATGIEIDVRTTKDGVPVIFHDSFFSIHTVQDIFYGGMLHDHTLAQVKQLRLRKGGTIPTLEEMLHCVLYETPLEIVWLDIKKECDMEMIRNIQRTFHQKAAAIGRTLHIYIGIPDSYVLKCFQQLEDFPQVPSLTEMDCNVALSINAEVWAPQYTGGFQSEDVARLHAEGKKAYVWSLDNKLMIDMYMSEGGFDGLVTNAAPVVVHWLYTEAARTVEHVA